MNRVQFISDEAFWKYIDLTEIKQRKEFLNSGRLKNITFKNKLEMAKEKVKEFLQNFDGIKNDLPYISFSGGKDSCVLRHLVLQCQKELGMKSRCNLIVAQEIFHPQTYKFIQTIMGPNDKILPWSKNFKDIISENGYPVIAKQLAQKISHIRNTKNHKIYIRATLGLDQKPFGTLPLIYCHFLDKNFVDYKISHKCCDYIKGNVKHIDLPCFVGTTIEESRLRRTTWIKYGCNYFNNKKSMCRPLSLWNEDDIWIYIDKFMNTKKDISPIYDLGYKRSGCIVCMFGMSLEKELSKSDPKYRNRFELLYDNKETKKCFDEFVLGDGYELWKPLTDMHIHLNVSNKKYKFLYKRRHKQIINWYENFSKNFNRVLDDIENRNPSIWTKRERKIIFNHYQRSCTFVLKQTHE